MSVFKHVATSAVLAVAVVAAMGCGNSNRLYYNNNDLQLLTGYTAKEACSCAFVMKREDDFCIEWTRASPDIRTVRIDRVAKTVEAQSVLFWGARAHYVSQRRGCVLE